MTLSPVPFAHFEVEVGPAVEMHDHVVGHRRMVPLLGGTVSGPIGTGVILPGGTDWQWVAENGRISLDAHYVLQLESGDFVEVESSGLRLIRDGGEVYFRTAIRLTAPPHRSDINDFLFLSVGTRTADRVLLDVFRWDD